MKVLKRQTVILFSTLKLIYSQYLLLVCLCNYVLNIIDRDIDFNFLRAVLIFITNE